MISPKINYSHICPNYIHCKIQDKVQSSRITFSTPVLLLQPTPSMTALLGHTRLAPNGSALLVYVLYCLRPRHGLLYRSSVRPHGSSLLQSPKHVGRQIYTGGARLKNQPVYMVSSFIMRVALKTLKHKYIHVCLK